MVFFIDFEASENNEIISMGCVSEFGDTFYSLIKPQEEYKNWYIKKLTGIRNKQLDTAPDVNEAFKNLYKWMFDLTYDDPMFICYGNEDVNFLTKSLSTATSLTAIYMITTIRANLFDYTPIFASKIETQNCSLQNAHTSLINDYKQKHNSLNDAIMLKNIFDYSFYKDFIAESIVAQKKKRKRKSKKKKQQINTVRAYNIEHELVQIFNSYAETVRWLQNDNNINSKTIYKYTRAIKEHSANNSLYKGYLFEIETKMI